MFCSKEKVFGFFDAFLLAAVFLFQSVILNYFIINHYRQSSFPFLWFLGDFLTLLVFAFTLYLAYRRHCRSLKPSCLKGSSSLNSSRNSSRSGHRSEATSESWPPSLGCLCKGSATPCSYISWLVYSLIIIAKIIIIFKAGIPQSLKADEIFFRPDMLKIAIACSAFVFSLLVEAHSDAHDDPIRNAFVKSTSYGMALEILDSVSFLSLLIVSETHLFYTFKFESFILGLSSVNLMLPAIALYKLTVSGFGETYPLPLEIIYKLLHIFMVNVPYLSVRLYLWQFYSYSDSAIFIVKNVYSIFSTFRALRPDVLKAFANYRQRQIGLSVHNINLQGTTPGPTNGSLPAKNGKRNGIEEHSVALTTFKSDQNEHESA